MYNIKIRDINPTARYNVTMAAYNDSADVETKTMDGEALIAMINGCAHLYDIDAELIPAEPETTPETTETAETAQDAQGAEREKRIADIIRDIRASRAHYRTKYRITAKAVRDAMRAGAPTVAIGYCELHLLECADPEAYTAGVYGWNFDVYRLGGLTICTGYRGMIGVDVDTTTIRKAAAALDSADLDARERMLAEWIYTTLAALREGARS